jgi:hypothetical protein
MVRLLLALGAWIALGAAAIGCGSGADPCTLAPRGHAAGCACVITGSRLCPSSLVCDGSHWVRMPEACLPSDGGSIDAGADADLDADVDASDT